MTNRLDSRALALFLAVAETLSFRQAAERVHLSQPPLSRAIRALEQRLGVRLFDRDTQRVSLTAAGQRLLPQARRIIRLLRDAEADITSMAREAANATAASTVSPLRLGLTSAVQPAWLSALLSQLQTGEAAGPVSTVADTSPRLVRRLRKHQLDAALIALPTETEGLHTTWLDRQPLVVALAASHPLARRRSLSLQQVGGGPMFWFERARQPAFFDHCQAVFDRHGFAPAVVREPEDHHMLLGGIARAEAFALLPASFAAMRHAGVRFRPLAEGEALAVGIGLVTATDRADLHHRLVAAARAATG